jgi:hypothetical protein
MIDDSDTGEEILNWSVCVDHWKPKTLRPYICIKKRRGSKKWRLCLTLTPKPLWNNKEGSQPLLLSGLYTRWWDKSIRFKFPCPCQLKVFQIWFVFWLCSTSRKMNWQHTHKQHGGAEETTEPGREWKQNNWTRREMGLLFFSSSPFFSA